MEIARGSGLTRSAWADDAADFERLTQRARSGDGPWFIGVRLDQQPPAAQTERDPAQITDRFMRGLGTKPPVWR